jgi:spore germination protein GerM
MAKKRTTMEALSLSDTPANEQPIEQQKAEVNQKTGKPLVKNYKKLTLYLPEPVREELRVLAFAERVKQHDLVMEAIDMLFKSRGIKSISELTKIMDEFTKL